VLQTPVQFDLHPATDEKNTARIKTQILMEQMLFIMEPWIPSKAIAFKAATAELWDDPCQSHVEIASQDLNPKFFDLVGTSIPELVVFTWPLHLHGPTIAMHTHDIKDFSNVAHVLFEVNLACEHPCIRRPSFLVRSVYFIQVFIVIEQLDASGVVCSSGNQQCRIFVASHYIMCEAASPR